MLASFIYSTGAFYGPIESSLDRDHFFFSSRDFFIIAYPAVHSLPHDLFRYQVYTYYLFTTNGPPSFNIFGHLPL